MYCCGEAMAKLNRQESAHQMLTKAAETEIMTNQSMKAITSLCNSNNYYYSVVCLVTVVICLQ